jgi:hypothetical protein
MPPRKPEHNNVRAKYFIGCHDSLTPPMFWNESRKKVVDYIKKNKAQTGQVQLPRQITMIPKNITSLCPVWIDPTKIT